MDNQPNPIRREHSDLEVCEQAGLEVVPSDHPEAVPQPPPQQPWHTEQQRQWGKSSNYPPAYPPGFIPNEGSPSSMSHSPGHAYNSPYDSSPKIEQQKERRFCGLKKQAFIIVLVLLVFFAVVAIALGVGLGLGLKKSDSAPATTTSTGSKPFVTGTTTYPAATATATVTPSLAVVCPNNNMTLYTAPAANKTFLLLCGRDYNKADGAIDLINLPAANMTTCMDMCASHTGCVGAGFGYYQNQNVCWLKQALGEPNNSPEWYFAVKETGDL